LRARLAERGRLVRAGWLAEPGWLAVAGRLAWSCWEARATGLPVCGGRGRSRFLLVGLGGKEKPRQPG
jgi:hypothetical protein